MRVPEDLQQKHLKDYINDVAEASNATYGLEASEKKQPFCLSPCTDIVMLLFVDYERAISATDDDGRLGGTSYHEFLVMQLALSHDKDFPELDWFIPFVYLDTDSPRLCGREIYGYPKQLGTISTFERYGKSELARTLELKSTVIRDAGDKEAVELPVIKIAGPRQRIPDIELRYETADKMIRDLFELSQPPTSIFDGPLLRAVLFANIGNVFLKQFRDCANPQERMLSSGLQDGYGAGKVPRRGMSGSVRLPDHDTEPGQRTAAQLHHRVRRDRPARDDDAGLRVLAGPRFRTDERTGDRQPVRGWVRARRFRCARLRPDTETAGATGPPRPRQAGPTCDSLPSRAGRQARTRRVAPLA